MLEIYAYSGRRGRLGHLSFLSAAFMVAVGLLTVDGQDLDYRIRPMPASDIQG
jgi:hypothetical protein